MDEIFGEENFVAQIAFLTTTSQTSKYLPPVADFVLWYAKSRDTTKFREKLIDKDFETSGVVLFCAVRARYGHSA